MSSYAERERADRPQKQGLAFDALQQCFRTADIDRLLSMQAPPLEWKQNVYIIVDPAAGGPRSDFAIISMVRFKGMATVRTRYTLS